MINHSDLSNLLQDANQHCEELIDTVALNSDLICEALEELLSYREAERKAKSWDDTEAWVQTRRKVTEFYDNTGHLRGKFYGEPEKRPK